MSLSGRSFGVGIIGGISLEIFTEHRVVNRYPRESGIAYTSTILLYVQQPSKVVRGNR